MSEKSTSSRKAIQERNRKKRRKQHTTLGIIIIGIGAILIGFAWYLITDPGSAQARFEYSNQDIVFDQPIQAVHEMGGSGLDAVPFLPKNGPQPKVVLLEDFFSFGSVGPTELATHDFVIANQGEAPLTISRAYTTCGCTTADFTATVIPPGKVSIVTMIYDAGFHDARGQTVRRGIIIENNDPKNPQVELWAQATVRNNP
jgi:hypothetical protein